MNSVAEFTQQPDIANGSKILQEELGLGRGIKSSSLCASLRALLSRLVGKCFCKSVGSIVLSDLVGKSHRLW